MMDLLPEEMAARFKGILERLDSLHRVRSGHRDLEEKKPYIRLIRMSSHLNEATALWYPLTAKRPRSIRQILVDRMPPQITYVPLLVTSCDYPFLKHMVRATAQAARCQELGIPALPLLWQVSTICDITQRELLTLTGRYFELCYAQVETIPFMERLHAQLLDCLRREES
jgi:hypothetical protein